MGYTMIYNYNGRVQKWYKKRKRAKAERSRRNGYGKWVGLVRVGCTKWFMGAGEAASSDVDVGMGGEHGGETTRGWERVD